MFECDWIKDTLGISHFVLCWEAVLFSEVKKWTTAMGKGFRRASFVGRLSLSRRVLDRRFRHCTCYQRAVVRWWEAILTSWFIEGSPSLWGANISPFPSPVHMAAAVTSTGDLSSVTISCYLANIIPKAFPPSVKLPYTGNHMSHPFRGRFAYFGTF